MMGNDALFQENFPSTELHYLNFNSKLLCIRSSAIRSWRKFRKYRWSKNIKISMTRTS